MPRIKFAYTTAALVVLALLSGAVPTRTQAPAFDLLIRGGRVLDGSGNPWFYGDVGVRDGRIAAVGTLTNATAKRTIDAAGKFVTPGFIDLHSHADGGLDEM